MKNPGSSGQLIGYSYAAPYASKNQGTLIDEAMQVWTPVLVERALQSPDIQVQIFFMSILKEKGLSVTVDEAAVYLARTNLNLPEAARQAQTILKQGRPAREAANPQNNPYVRSSDFMGLADMFGIISPGMPQTMMDIAEEFGGVMSYGEGLDAGYFIGGMYSAAYFYPDPLSVVQQGIESVHPRSQLRGAVQDVVIAYANDPDDWQACWNMLQQKWGGANIPRGAKINAAYATLGLLYGGGDFEKTLEITTRCGLDTTNNASTAAGVLGAIKGFSRIPSEYTSGILVLGDRQFQNSTVTFDSLIAESRRLAEQVMDRYGGTSTRLGDRDYYLVPVQDPRPPRRFDQ